MLFGFLEVLFFLLKYLEMVCKALLSITVLPYSDILASNIEENLAIEAYSKMFV